VSGARGIQARSRRSSVIHFPRNFN